MNTCQNCGADLPVRVGRGRRASYCSPRCRVAAHRARRPAFPTVMTDARRWCRADRKRPVTVDGRAASSTNPTTWASYANVVASTRGNGIGFMLGDGIGCYDLDHVTDEQARAFLEQVDEPVLFVERSVSGTGIHVFVQAEPGPGSKRLTNGISVEFYSRARFIRTTGRRFS